MKKEKVVSYAVPSKYRGIGFLIGRLHWRSPQPKRK